jgi:hemerythrin
VLKELISKLNAYTAMHFGREEHYFELFSYPESEAHQKEHADFEDRIIEFEKEFDRGGQDLSMEIMNFLSNWLVNHIKDSDKKYGPFLNERGLK